VRLALPKSPLLLFLAVATWASAAVLIRIETGTAPYDQDWAALADRLRVGQVLTDFLSGEGAKDFLIFDLDNFGYPPGLHVVSWLWTPLLGYSATAIRGTGLMWLFLLAGSVGVVASELARTVTGHGLGGALARSSPSTGLTAAAGILLLGSYQVMATIYYFDLPFTALVWTATAALLKFWDRKPVLAAVLSGLTFAAAALTKWTALVYGGALLAGLGLFALCSAPRRRTGRMLACGGTIAVAAGLILSFLSAVGPNGSPSLGAMTGTFDPDTVRPPLGAAFHTAERLLGQGTPELKDKLDWYLDHSIRSVISPALTWPLSLLLGLWAILSRRGATLIVPAALIQLAFLVIVLPVKDERFIITAVPALIVAGALGLRTLPRPIRQGLCLAIVGLATGVSYDFHFAQKDLPWLSDEPAYFTNRGWEMKRWGLDNSARPDLSWARGDASAFDSGTPLAGHARGTPGSEGMSGQGAKALVEALAHCGARRLAFAEDSPGWVHQQSEFMAVMMSEEFRVGTPRNGRFTFHHLNLVPDLSSATSDGLKHSFDLALVAAGEEAGESSGSKAYYPPEVPPGLLEPVRTLAPEWGRLWRPVGSTLCDGLGGTSSQL
jgi:hypothetical protein